MVSFKTTSKANRVLQIILILLLIISLRIWFLSILQREERLKEARKPALRTLALPAPRGMIFDRKGFPLAMNRIRYDVAIYYSPIRQIPSIGWTKGQKGEKIKWYPRKEYIKTLSQLLAKELQIDAEDIEDTIHAKASLLPHLPFVIKENIAEEKYYRLRMLERQWRGLHAIMTFERYYPEHCAASSVIGYLGAINAEEYWSLAGKMQILQTFLEEEENEEDPPLPEGYRSREEVVKDLAQLKELSYSMHDLIGKSGLEKRFEEQLRGVHGKKIFEVDVNGSFIKELPQSHPPIAGKPLVTALSLELQKFAEALLAEDERYREGKSLIYNSSLKKRIPQKQPLLKGGAIVALDPNNGEILALASYPRFDPNDFVPSSHPLLHKEKQRKVLQWLEIPSYIARIWDGKEPLTLERFSSKEQQFVWEEKELTWELFLQTIFPRDSFLFDVMEKIGNVNNAALLQEDVESLLYFSGQKNVAYLFDLLFVEEENHKATGIPIPEKCKLLILQNWAKNRSEVAELKKRLLSFLGTVRENQDKLFLIDLCRIAVCSPSFSNELLQKVGLQSLPDYWKISREKIALETALYEPVFSLFHEVSFKEWRKEWKKPFLKQKRQEEKKEKKFPRPYIDYLQEEEKKLFAKFWQEHAPSFLLFLLKGIPFAHSHDPYFAFIEKIAKELPLEKYAHLQKQLSLLSPPLSYEYLRSMRSFEALDRPLLFAYPSLRKNHLEKDLASSFYSSHSYGISFAYRHGAPLGSIFKLVTAYAALKERYQHLEHPTSSLLNPFTFVEEFSYADQKKTAILGHDLQGKPFAQHYKGGKLPKSIHRNLGTIDLIHALERSSNPYFSLLAGDFLESPEALLRAAKDFGLGEKTGIDLPGEVSGQLPEDLAENRTGLYSFAIGQHTLLTTPLQTAVLLSALANGGKVLQPQILKNAPLEIQNEIFLPPSVRKLLFEGMDKVVWGEKGSARAAIIHKLSERLPLLKDYLHLEHTFIGKTSTAEFTFKSDLLPSSKPQKYNDTWFGAISFDSAFPQWEKAELVVVVYLAFGDRGKDAAPLAAEMIKKYRELKEKEAL